MNYPDPVAQAGEALIRVRLAGVCATDLELTAGYKGGYCGVLGHEFVGEVVAAPDTPQWIGKRVVGEINIGCGRCDLCRRGLGKHCRRRQSLGIMGRDGAFADYLTLPIANLYEVPDTVRDEQAVFTEPLAAAFEITAQVPVHPTQRVYVVGDGRLALLAAQVLAATGCDLTVVGRYADKLAVLQGTPAVTCLDSERARAELAEQPADLVVEATGTPGGFATARQLVRPGGTIVLKSTYVEALQQVDLSGLVVDEVTVVGSRCGPFAPALRLLGTGCLRTDAMIHARYRLEDGVAALEHAGRRGVLKVLIEP